MIFVNGWSCSFNNGCLWKFHYTKHHLGNIYLQKAYCHCSYIFHAKAACVVAAFQQNLLLLSASLITICDRQTDICTVQMCWHEHIAIYIGTYKKCERISQQQVTKFVTLSVFNSLSHFYNFLFDQMCT
jgi:hypothetical protein